MPESILSKLLLALLCLLVSFENSYAFAGTMLAKGRHLISLKTSTSNSPTSVEESVLTVTLKNQSTSELVLPDFHDSTFNAAYFFDLELQAIESDSNGKPKAIEVLRPYIPIKAAHSLPQLVKLTPGNEYAYVLHLKNWNVLAKTPPICRKVASGKYLVRVIWRPSNDKKWFQEIGLHWIEPTEVRIEKAVAMIVK